MNPPETHKEFTWVEGLALCLAMIGVQLSSELINTWGTYFYSPSEGGGRMIYVSIGLVGFIFVAGAVWDAVTDPLVGIWSDKTRTRPGRFRRWFPVKHGRRRPFIFAGSVLMTATGILFWYPPVADTSAVNFAYGTALLCLHWLFFTMTVVPLFGLGPEIARSEQARVRLGTWVGVGMLVGLAIAVTAPGVLITLLDPARAEGAYSPDGNRRVAILFAFISLGLFQLPVWLIRERYDSEAAPSESAALVNSFRDAARNKPFIIYFVAFFLFTIGFLAAQRVLPYWAELGLDGDEGTVTILMLPFIVAALLAYAAIPFVARRLHVKWMIALALGIIATGMPWMYVIGVMDASSSAKVALGATLFAYCGIGQAIIYVMMVPMIGEIADYDERRLSGQRREALYNSLSQVAWKGGMAGSVLLATQSMHLWGNSAENPTGVFLVGPLAGACALLGVVAMLFYPNLKVTPPAEGEAPPG